MHLWNVECGFRCVCSAEIVMWGSVRLGTYVPREKRSGAEWSGAERAIYDYINQTGQSLVDWRYFPRVPYSISLVG